MKTFNDATECSEFLDTIRNVLAKKVKTGFWDCTLMTEVQDLIDDLECAMSLLPEKGEEYTVVGSYGEYKFKMGCFLNSETETDKKRFKLSRGFKPLDENFEVKYDVIIMIDSDADRDQDIFQALHSFAEEW